MHNGEFDGVDHDQRQNDLIESKNEVAQETSKEETKVVINRQANGKIDIWIGNAPSIEFLTNYDRVEGVIIEGTFRQTKLDAVYPDRQRDPSNSEDW